MNDKLIIATNIQRFSLHDGPGIRTTVFLKGCSLRCPWCANPENLDFRTQNYINNGENGVYGREYSCFGLFDEIVRDKAFYDGDWGSSDLNKMPGGVTFSGGECLLQMNKMEPLLEILNKEKIHTAVETSLFAPCAMLMIAIKYIDLFYIDIKILDKDLCSSILLGDLQLYFSNLHMIFDSGKPIVFRVPVIGGFTDSNSNRSQVVELIKSFQSKILKVELIKEHSLGINKYRTLVNAGNAIKLPKFVGVSDELMDSYKLEIERAVAVPVSICKI